MKAKTKARRFMVIILYLFGIVLVSLILIDLIFLRTTPSPMYSENSVRQLCNLFSIPSGDDFCSNVNQQTWYSLEALLERHFPTGQATFQHILHNIEINDVELNELPNITGFAKATCPNSLIESDIYTCYIVFKEDIDIRPINITFDRRTDIIIKIGVGHTGN